MIKLSWIAFGILIASAIPAASEDESGGTPHNLIGDQCPNMKFNAGSDIYVDVPAGQRVLIQYVRPRAQVSWINICDVSNRGRPPSVIIADATRMQRSTMNLRDLEPSATGYRLKIYSDRMHGYSHYGWSGMRKYDGLSPKGSARLIWQTWWDSAGPGDYNTSVMYCFYKTNFISECPEFVGWE